MFDRDDLTLFFVAGSRRCGSTWLQSMLAMHPQIIIRNEGRFFRGDDASIDHWLDLDRVGRWAATPAARDGWLRDIEADELQPILIRGMIQAVMREAVRRTRWKDPAGVRAVGDKTTVHLLERIELVAACFPRARLVHLVRDGRDVVVSDVFMRFAQGSSFEGLSPAAAAHARAACAYHAHGRGEPTDLLGDELLESLARTWARSIANAQRARELLGDRFMEVRYEDLLADPRGVGSILAFLGVACDGALVERIVTTTSFARQSGGRQPGQADPLSFVRSGVAGDWQRWLSPRNRVVFHRVAGQTLVALGYEPDDRWAAEPT